MRVIIRKVGRTLVIVETLDYQVTIPCGTKFRLPKLMFFGNVQIEDIYLIRTTEERIAEDNQ